MNPRIARSGRRRWLFYKHRVFPRLAGRVMVCLALTVLAFLGCGGTEKDIQARKRVEERFRTFFDKDGALSRSVALDLCSEALEKRLNGPVRLIADADERLLWDDEDGFSLRSIVDLQDEDGDLVMRSWFECRVEPTRLMRWGGMMSGDAEASVDALDAGRRHALWPWPPQLARLPGTM